MVSSICGFRVRALLAGILCGLAAAVSVRAQSGAKEYQVKAVYLYNFAEFVEWPPTAFSGQNAPLIIGVLGDDPFGSVLDETVHGEQANGRDLVVRRYRVVDEIAACHILFVSRSETDRLAPILRALRGRSILTISDAADFARRGGMVRFVTENHRIRLRVNLDAVKAANLTISSKLLRTVELVNGSDQ